MKSSSKNFRPALKNFQNLCLAICLSTASVVLVARAASAAPKMTEVSHKANIVAFTLIDNRIFTDVYLNDAGPFKVIFDTGGCLSINPEVAARLHCPMQKDGLASGAGENSVPLLSTEISKVRLGDLLIVHQKCLVIDYSVIQKKFAIPLLEGVIGLEFLKRQLVKIDFDKQHISFFAAANPSLTKGFRKILCRFVNGKPVVNGFVDGHAAKILIDTGDRSALTIRQRFVEETSMNKVYDGVSEQVTGYGIGGAIFGKVARVDSLKLAPDLLMRDVITRMPTAVRGFNAMDDFDCSIGNEILKHFDLIFDYRGNAVYLRPNKFFDARTEFLPVAQ